MIGDFDRGILEHVGHRPWPMPEGPWVMTQTWHDVLFAHWPVDPRFLDGRIPSRFELDLFHDRAWLGIVPFHITNAAPRLMPAVPWISAFPEVNVRTYVRVDDRPGVYFFSLDAASAVAVRLARALLNLPYFHAVMHVETNGATVTYDSARKDDAARFRARYEATGSGRVAQADSLDEFLVERYCLYNLGRGGVPYRLEIHHPPWRLQPADAEIEEDTLAQANRLPPPKGPLVLHFAKRQDVVVWPPVRLSE
jgi:uncharacterized protein YqjF (DUF2071 family)